MQIKIEFYGRLKAEFSTAPITVEIQQQANGVTIKQIYQQLCQKHNLSDDTSSIKPILNDTFAEWDDRVNAHDVIGLFPPASGG